MAKKKAKRHGATGKGSEPPRDEGAPAGDAGEESERAADEAGAADEGDSPAGDGESAAAAVAKEPEPSGPGGGEPPKPPAKKGKPWGDPFARFEAGWTKLETRLITWVLIAQLASMVAWVLLSGLSSPIQSGNASGLVMRGVLGAVGLGSGFWFATRKMNLTARRGAAILGLVLGALAAPLWRSVGVDYFDNLRSWLQEGSTLTLMGGLRGVATRLTLWLALLGASLATATGKHINIDVIFRFVPARFRLPIAVVNYGAAALVCFGAVWGFFDHIAIESYGAKADDTAGAKITISAERMGDHLFLARKQMGLDFKTFPHIVKGDRYDQWMSPRAWNDWVKDGGFDGRYKKEEVEAILIAEDAPPHTPLVLAPDGESTRGILVHDLSLVFPFGMLVLALRFLLRALLALSGHVEVDPDAAHKEEIGVAHAPHTPAEPEKGGA